MTNEEVENLEMLTDLAEQYDAKLTFDYIGNKELWIIKFKVQMLRGSLKVTGGDLKEVTDDMKEKIKSKIIE